MIDEQKDIDKIVQRAILLAAVLAGLAIVVATIVMIVGD